MSSDAKAAADVFERWVREHHAAVYRSAYRILQREDDALDAAQQAFVRALERVDELRRADEPEHVLRRMAVRAALEQLRSRASRRRREDRYAMERDEREPDASVRCTDEEEREALWGCVARLGDELRVPLVLRYQEGLTYEAIASALGCSAPTAHERVQRGVDRLRARLARIGMAALVPRVEIELAAESPVALPAGLVPKLLAANPAQAGFVAASTLSTSLVVALVASIAAIAFLAQGDAPREDVAVAAGAAGEREALVAAPEPEAAAAGAARALVADDERTPLEVPPAGAGDDESEAVTAFGTLAGRVVDADGVGLAGVDVTATSRARHGKLSRFSVDGATAADGSYRLRVPVALADGQDYVVHASHGDYAASRTPTVRVGADETCDVPSMTMRSFSDDVPGAFELTVSVLDESGVPLSGVRVQLYRVLHDDAGEDVLQRETHHVTDANGAALLRGERLGEKRLWVDGRSVGWGQAELVRAVPWSGAHEELVVLDRGLHLAGRVTAVEGTIDESVWTQVRPVGGSWDAWVHVDVDERGAFRAHGLNAGPHELRVAGTDWSTFQGTLDAGREDVTIELKRADDPRDVGDHLAELHGRVVDAESGAPLAIDWLAARLHGLDAAPSAAELRADVLPNLLYARPVQVSLGLGGPPRDSSELHETGLDAGTWLIVVRERGRGVGFAGPFALGEHTLVAGFEVALVPEAVLSGRVLGADGRPLVDAYLLVTGRGPRSDARVRSIDEEIRNAADDSAASYAADACASEGGAFRLAGLPADLPLRIAVLHPSHEPLVVDAPPLQPGATADGLELRLRVTRER